MPASSDFAELSTLRAQIADVTKRVVQVADSYRDTADSEIASDLDQVERALVTAQRALEHATDALSEKR
jgi:hypothetical protein